jgi:hypothetical protein
VTTRISHSTHQWNHQLGECRYCGAGLSTPEAEQPCAKAPPRVVSPVRRSKGGTPDLFGASLVRAKDLVRK